MYSRFHCLMHFVVAVSIGFAGFMAAQAQSPAPSTGTATLRGHIADPTGALIPGAKITITNALGVTQRTTTSDAAGTYAVTGLAPGSYIVQATVDGFAPFTSPTLQLAAGQSKRVDISMAIEAEQQSVTVSDDEGAPQVSTEAGSNASAIVLKGKDLDALSDDPDELSNELTALAGPSAGPNGGQIYIDGFTGGTTAAQVGHPRDSHQPESVLGGVRPASATAASRFSPSRAPTSCTGALLRPGQRQRLQHRQPVHHGNLPSYHSYPVQRHHQRRAQQEGFVLPQRGRPRQPGRQHLHRRHTAVNDWSGYYIPWIELAHGIDLPAASSAPPSASRFRRASTCSWARKTR